MLADDFIFSSTNQENKTDMRLLGDHVLRAEKFVLDDATVDAVKQISSWKSDSLFSALPLCRPPYPLTWIEYTGGHETVRELTKLNGDTLKRTGVLIEIINGDYTNMIATEMFNYSNRKEIGVSHLSLRLSTENKFLGPRIIPDGFTYKSKGSEKLGSHIGYMGNFYTKNILKYDLIDQIYASFIGRFVIGCLAVLNSRNVVERVPSDLNKLNKSRTKSGKDPLCEYTTIKIHLNKRDAKAATADRMSQAEIRRHMVRGHFKVKKNGIYWWRPFIRGAAQGEVHHLRYDVSK